MSNINVKELVNSYTPCQIMFWDGEGYCAGIMVGELIICGCCGGTFDLNEIINLAREDKQVPIRVFDTWVDISDEIKGDEDEVMSTIPLEF